MMEVKDGKVHPGLLPMGLAETSKNAQSNRFNYFLRALQKILIIIFFLVFIIAVYVLILKFLEVDEKICKTEIIVVSNVQEQSNITVSSEEVNRLHVLKNRTNGFKKLRSKREVLHKDNIRLNNNHSKVKLQDNKKQNAKQMISGFDVLCNDKAHREACKELINKLKYLTENDVISNPQRKRDKNNINDKNKQDDKFNNDEGNYQKGNIIKRETMDMQLLEPASFETSPNILQPYPSELPIPQLSDNCLLTRLMRQSSQNLYGYDDLQTEYDQNMHTYPRQIPLNFLPTYARSHGEGMRKPHPQDIEIALNVMSKQSPLDFLTSFSQDYGEDRQNTKPHPQDIDTALNIKSNCRPAKSKDSSSVHDCPEGTMSCDNGDCISEKLWCDGNVDCEDVSDESRCSCKERVDKTRVCDGYFDCPFGEDEMGCFGCRDNTFSCDNQDSVQSTCFTSEQRCNNIADCPNHKDETDCTMLAPSLHKKPLFAVSNTEGYLHRNFKGIWYAVCNNPYMWAHDACRRETGLIIRPPFIQIHQIDPLLKVNYLSTAPGGLIHNSTTCLNSSAVYVTCPDLLCGTRILSASHLIKENAEYQLFGRNKRFLLHNYPYHFFFYGPRTRGKRDAPSSQGTEEIRNKRSESRVVGGKPSQPAAWPWVVALYRDGQFHCGGVIVNQNWIMSAAHCVHKYWQHYYEVQVGMLRRFSFSPQEQNYRVTHVIVNQNYDQQDMKNDLSLLRVKPVIHFNRWVRPICLPGPEVAGPDWLWGPQVGTICTAVGWGSTIEHGPDPDHLREVELPVWEHCNHREDQAGKEICAGFAEGGRDTCQGDSGGPLLCQNPANEQQWYVAGIVSHGDGCARKGEPGVYTRVSLLVPWIKYHISSKSLPIIQPKQECPGFRCNSGISKCLPKNRMYDKIIDCLDGEDEVNCEVKQTRNIIEEILSIPFSRNANISKNFTNDLIKKDESMTINVTEHSGSIATTTQTVISSIISSETTTVNNMNLNNNHEIVSNNNTILKITSLGKVNKINKNLLQTTTTTEIETESTTDPNEKVTDDYFEITTNEPSFTQKIVKVPSKIQGESMLSTSLENSNEPLTTDSGASIVTKTDSNILYVTSDKSPYLLITENDMITSTENLETTTDFLDEHILSTITSDENIPSPITTNSYLDKNISVIGNPIGAGEDELNVVSTNVTDTPTKLDNTINSSITDIENNIIDVVEATRYKIKHKTPSHFQCRKISQIIPYKNRCDHKADCEDGTDELDCTCIDYLTTFESQLICDGNYNCADGQDEIDCFGCDDDQFLCKRSQMCLSSKYVCDGKPQCPLGEDELDCFALTNGKDVRYDIDGRPKVRFEGYVAKKLNNDWHVICEEDLSIHDQEEAAIHICRYLGFSNANSYKIKYINMKESNLIEIPVDNKRSKRNKLNIEPVMFTYTKFDNDKKQTRNVVIREPEVLKEQCLPNVTKTCMTLYVSCDQSLYTNFDVSTNLLFSRTAEDNFVHQWPWVAKLYTDGHYKCTGVLIDISWVLFSNECLDLNLQNPRYNTVILGSHKTLFSTKSLYEQVYKVDAIKDLYSSKIILLHLQEPAEYSTMVKPMIPPSVQMGSYERSLCIAVGQDGSNNTVSVLLKETREGCSGENVICFVRQSTVDTCPNGFSVEREWAGIISCHNKQGWYPAASFIEPRGECNIGSRLTATVIGNLKREIKYYDERPLASNDQELLEDCDGARCQRGRCINMRQVCDGVRHCEDGIDEAPISCKKKYNICSKDPLHRGCECPVGQLKCRNGQCVSKELFKDGHNDCVDGTDEPGQTTCSDYLSRVMPSRLCDGVLHCHDRSDEDPMFCKCFAKHAYKCGRDMSSEDYCVATDMVCDGIPDCPNSEDERTCIALSAPQGTQPGIGEVIIRSHGVWYSKCYPTQTHIKSELEEICRELGFISGHAKQLPTPDKSHPHNNIVIDQFSDIILNNSTQIKLRNSQAPIARGTLDDLSDCFPLFIECL